jgi:hypothetical protein
MVTVNCVGQEAGAVMVTGMKKLMVLETDKLLVLLAE